MCNIEGLHPTQKDGSFKIFREIAAGENARSILEEHVSTMKQYAAEVERIVDRF